MTDEKQEKVVNLFKQNAKPQRKPASPKPSNVIYINGAGNVVGNGNTVIHTQQVIHRPTVQVKTGDGVVTAQQKARLQKLVNDWLTLRNAVRKTKFTHAAAWTAVNKQAKVNSYHEIPAEKFVLIEKWLMKQIAIINSMPSASSKSPDRRKSRYTAIHSKCNELDIKEARIKYMQDKYGKTSMTDLTDEQLEQVYKWVFSK